MAVTDSVQLNAAAMELLCTGKTRNKRNFTGEKLRKTHGIKANSFACLRGREG